MARQLVLHHMNAGEAAPAAFVRLAAAHGCDAVTLFAFEGSRVLPSSNAGLSYPAAVTPENEDEVRAALAETGVSLEAVEFFPITAEVDLELYRPALARGKSLGAKRAVTHMFILEDAPAVEKLGRFSEMAKAEGLALTAEFCPMTPGNPSLARAAWFVDQLGSGNFRIGFDALHAARSGCTAEDVLKLGPEYFGIAQICDAHGRHVSSNYFAEVHNREVPGKGDLPLHELLSAIPASVAIEIEVPAAHRRAAGISTAQHISDVIAGAREVVDNLAPVR